MHAFAPLYDADLPDDPALGPFCYLSVVTKSLLRPYKNYDDQLQISDAIDPLISFMRAYFDNPYLVYGCLMWDNNDQVGHQTKRAYTALVKWMRREWEWLGPKLHIGPEAKRLTECGAHLVLLHPKAGARLQIIATG